MNWLGPDVNVLDSVFVAFSTATRMTVLYIIYDVKKKDVFDVGFTI